MDKSNGSAIITLNRPKSINVLNNELLRELDRAIADIVFDERIKVVISTFGFRFH